MPSRMRAIILRPLTQLALVAEVLVDLCERALARARAERLFPGKQLRTRYSTVFKMPERIVMGNHVWIGPEVTIGAAYGVTLEDRVRISQGAYIETGGLNLSAPLPYPHQGAPIHIGEGAWIGARSVILQGVRIGCQAVVAAGAVVVRDVPDNAIAGGVPAKVIGYRPGHGPSSETSTTNLASAC